MIFLQNLDVCVLVHMSLKKKKKEKSFKSILELVYELHAWTKISNVLSLLTCQLMTQLKLPSVFLLVLSSLSSLRKYKMFRMHTSSHSCESGHVNMRMHIHPKHLIPHPYLDTEMWCDKTYSLLERQTILWFLSS